MADSAISIGAVFCLLLSALLFHWLAKRREKESHLNQEIRGFKERLTPTIKALEEGECTPATIVLSDFPKQDVAARKLLLHLPSKKKKQLQERWDTYSGLHKEKNSWVWQH